MRRQTLLIFIIILLLSSAGAQSEYKVKPGDTFYGISLIFDVPVELLMQHNGLKEGALLLVDQVLAIPGTYEVKPGDTYYGISRALGVTVGELLEYNNRTENTILLAGESLQIPVKEIVIAATSEKEVNSGEDQADTGNSERSAESSDSGDHSGETATERISTLKNSLGSFFWPHEGSRSRLTGKLKGEQFSGNPGDSIFSVSSGSVIWVAPYRGYNKLIIVKSPDTHVYAYGGNDLCLVKVGDSVFPGMEIGRLGVNPHEGQAKAFFFVYKDGIPVDPVKAPRV